MNYYYNSPKKFLSKQEIRDNLSLLTGVEIPNFSVKSSMSIQEKDLQQVANLFQIWKEYIPEKAYSNLLKNLIIDLITLHCCTVCGTVASACYIGKQAECEIEVAVPDNKYTSYTLNTNQLKTCTAVFGAY